MRATVTILFLLKILICYPQANQIDFCDDNLQKDTLIGKKVKLFHANDMIYNIDFTFYGISDTDLIHNLEIKDSYNEKKSLLSSGQIGEIVYVSDKPIRLFKDGSGNIQKKFYVIKIADNYFPIDCEQLIEITDDDEKELNKKWNDLYKAYPNECVFNFENISWIDKYSSAFACELMNQNIDTILYAKLITQGFARKNHVSIVMWFRNGCGFMKAFSDEGFRKLIRETEQYPFDWHILLNSYTSKKKDFRGFVKNDGFTANYDVLLILPDDKYRGIAWIDINSIYSNNNFSRSESSEKNFYFYLERVFKMIKK